MLVTEQVGFDSCFGVQSRELDCAHLTEKIDCFELYTKELDSDLRFSLGSELDCDNRFRLSDGDVTGERHLGLASGE